MKIWGVRIKQLSRVSRQSEEARCFREPDGRLNPALRGTLKRRARKQVRQLGDREIRVATTELLVGHQRDDELERDEYELAMEMGRDDYWDDYWYNPRYADNGCRFHPRLPEVLDDNPRDTIYGYSLWGHFIALPSHQPVRRRHAIG